MEKYYIIKRLTSELLNDYLTEIHNSKKQTILKRMNPAHQLLLVEKTIVTDEIGTDEHYTNLWTMNEGVSSQWEDIVKENILYDYTGIVTPLIHLHGRVMNFDEYCNKFHK